MKPMSALATSLCDVALGWTPWRLKNAPTGVVIAAGDADRDAGVGARERQHRSAGRERDQDRIAVRGGAAGSDEEVGREPPAGTVRTRDAVRTGLHLEELRSLGEVGDQGDVGDADEDAAAGAGPPDRVEHGAILTGERERVRDPRRIPGLGLAGPPAEAVPVPR